MQNMPAMMNSIHVEQAGGPEQITLQQIPLPVIGAGQVLIKTCAAGMNRADILQRRGLYPPPTGAPVHMGLEVSGIIVAIGPNINTSINATPNPWKIGDRVCALLTGGGYAEYVAAHTSLCLPVPDHMHLTEAAALPEALFTVWQTIFEIGQFKKGNRVLIHGGASGIGSMAIQMVHAMNGTAIATCGTDAKVQTCLKLGAETAINYRTQDFVEILKFHPVDIVLDMVGGDYIARNIDCMAREARHISIAYLENAYADIPIAKIMQKRITLTGSTLRNAPLIEKEHLALSIRNAIWPMLTQGIIRPVIHNIYPFIHTAAAHQAFEKGEHTGKILLSIAPELT